MGLFVTKAIYDFDIIVINFLGICSCFTYITASITIFIRYSRILSTSTIFKHMITIKQPDLASLFRGYAEQFLILKTNQPCHALLQRN